MHVGSAGRNIHNPFTWCNRRRFWQGCFYVAAFGGLAFGPTIVRKAVNSVGAARPGVGTYSPAPVGIDPHRGRILKERLRLHMGPMDSFPHLHHPDGSLYQPEDSQGSGGSSGSGNKLGAGNQGR